MGKGKTFNFAENFLQSGYPIAFLPGRGEGYSLAVDQPRRNKRIDVEDISLKYIVYLLSYIFLVISRGTIFALRARDRGI